MSDQPDLFGDGEAVLADKKLKTKEAPQANSGGNGGGLPPHFAPLSGELGDSLFFFFSVTAVAPSPNKSGWSDMDGLSSES